MEHLSVQNRRRRSLSPNFSPTLVYPLPNERSRLPSPHINNSLPTLSCLASPYNRDQEALSHSGTSPPTLLSPSPDEDLPQTAPSSPITQLHLISSHISVVHSEGLKKQLEVTELNVERDENKDGLQALVPSSLAQRVTPEVPSPLSTSSSDIGTKSPESDTQPPSAIPSRSNSNVSSSEIVTTILLPIRSPQKRPWSQISGGVGSESGPPILANSSSKPANATETIIPSDSNQTERFTETGTTPDQELGPDFDGSRTHYLSIIAPPRVIQPATSIDELLAPAPAKLKRPPTDWAKRFIQKYTAPPSQTAQNRSGYSRVRKRKKAKKPLCLPNKHIPRKARDIYEDYDVKSTPRFRRGDASFGCWPSLSCGDGHGESAIYGGGPAIDAVNTFGGEAKQRTWWIPESKVRYREPASVTEILGFEKHAKAFEDSFDSAIDLVLKENEELSLGLDEKGISKKQDFDVPCSLRYDTKDKMRGSTRDLKPYSTGNQLNKYTIPHRILYRQQDEKNKSISRALCSASSVESLWKGEKPSLLKPLTDIVFISLGENVFAIYRDFLNFYSPTLAEACRDSGSDLVMPIVLEDVDVHVFGLFVQWLYVQQITNKYGRPAYQHRLMQLWVLASRLRMPRLQNDAIDGIEERRRMGERMQTKTFRYVYLNTVDGDLLRKYLVDICAAEMGTFPPELVEERFPKEMMDEIAEARLVKVEPEDGGGM